MDALLLLTLCIIVIVLLVVLSTVLVTRYMCLKRHVILRWEVPTCLFRVRRDTGVVHVDQQCATLYGSTKLQEVRVCSHCLLSTRAQEGKPMWRREHVRDLHVRMD